jgi:hypothetical protein
VQFALFLFWLRDLGVARVIGNHTSSNSKRSAQINFSAYKVCEFRMALLILQNPAQILRDMVASTVFKMSALAIASLAATREDKKLLSELARRYCSAAGAFTLESDVVGVKVEHGPVADPA